MRQISGDVIKVITADEHFPLGAAWCHTDRNGWPAFCTSIWIIYKAFWKLLKHHVRKMTDQSLITQGWQRGKCTCSWVMGILTRVWRTSLRGDNKPVFKWLCAWYVGAQSLSCVWLWDSMDCSLPGSSVHGIFQARILESVAISFFRGSSWPRDQTCVSCIPSTSRQILDQWATWDSLKSSHFPPD